MVSRVFLVGWITRDLQRTAFRKLLGKDIGEMHHIRKRSMLEIRNREKLLAPSSQAGMPKSCFRF